MLTKISTRQVFFISLASTMISATMKRFIVATILTLVIVGVLAYFMPRDFQAYLTKFDSRATVTIYCRQTNLVGVDMGCGFKVECSADNFLQSLSECSSVDGISVSFEGEYQDVSQLREFFRLQVSSVYEQDGLYVICGKSPRIRSGIFDGGNVVNLQIAYKDGVVHLGSPLILGDY